jgi:S-DNA-T family DNA segregation ATPase FtsK/SpoIIIE
MANKKADTSKAASAEVPRTKKGRFARYCLVLALAGLVVLLWLSMLTFSHTDPPARWVWPPEPSVDNAAGQVGSYVAYGLRYWLGGGAYMGLLFATVAAAILICGGRIGDLPWRVAGAALMVATTSAAAFLLDPNVQADIAGGSAGVLGTAIGHLLLSRLSQMGGWLILIVSLCTGVMLTADSLVLRLPALGRKVWARRNELANVVKVFAPGEGARAEARCVTGSPRAIAVIPASSGRAAEVQPRRQPVVPPPEPEEPEARDNEPKQKRPRFLPLFRGHKDKGEPADRQDKPPVRNPGADGYVLPPVDVLADPSGGYIQSQEIQAAQKRLVLQQTLSDFNVQAQVVGHMTGPVITLFELSLSPGVKVSQVANLANDIARALAVPGVRIVSPLPGRDTVGVEVPNLDKEIVRLKELMALAPEAEKRMHLPLYLGKDAGGNPIVADLGGMPHLLVAGTTGSGKSVCINSIIVALLMTRTPEDVRFVLIDPKMVEMAAFENIPHLLCPIVNDVRHAEDILEWAAGKMDERYELLKTAGVKNIASFNRLSKEEICERFGAETEEERAGIPTRLQYYIIIVDELADLIMTSSKEVESHIIRIAQKARAVGIHMILATQRPSVNVVTGLIKSNMPCRISFRVASRQESRIVLDQNGADVLLGGGDMLFLQPGTSNLIRAQGTFVDDAEIRAVVESVGKGAKVEYHEELVRLSLRMSGEGAGEKDELFDKAVEIVLATQRGSVSLLQRRLQIGYSRASRIIDQMADAGILGEYKGSQARECLTTLEEWQALKESIAADQSGSAALNGEPTSV